MLFIKISLCCVKNYIAKVYTTVQRQKRLKAKAGVVRNIYGTNFPCSFSCLKNLVIVHWRANGKHTPQNTGQGAHTEITEAELTGLATGQRAMGPQSSRPAGEAHRERSQRSRTVFFANEK